MWVLSEELSSNHVPSNMADSRNDDVKKNAARPLGTSRAATSQR